MLSAGRLSFSHKRRANSVALPLVSHKSVRLKIVKRNTWGGGPFVRMNSHISRVQLCSRFASHPGSVSVGALCGWSKTSRFAEDGKSWKFTMRSLAMM